MNALSTPILQILYLVLATKSYLLDPIPLDRDPAYRAVLNRRLTYPSVRYEYKVALMVYAHFSIDQRGHVQHVRIISPQTPEFHHQFYETVVKSTLKRLPPLNSTYAGQYILPVAFSVRDYDTGQLVVPDEMGYPGEQEGSVLLQKVEVVGDRRMPKRS